MTAVDSPLAAALHDRYVIERELGRGGMATVYLARDLRHRRPVALKVLHPDLAHALGPERFLREIETAAGLQHPHIVPLFDSGEAAGLLYYVMPYVEGESLRNRLAREKQLQIDEALEFARQVASALAYAHVRGVIHRDIKPENILLEGDQAVVADFGIAWAVSVSGGERLTGTGMAIGTPAYMSPEQASGERDIDGRSDIYSLACVLYEMLAGHAPFHGASAQQVMARHATDPVPPLRTVRPSVPPALEEVVSRALTKVPADRFPSADRFAQALTRLDQRLAPGITPATAAGSARGAAGRVRRGVPARRVALGLTAAIMAIAGAIAAFLWRGLPATSGSAVARHTQLTFIGNVDRQDISADGKLLAYVERGDTFRLLVKDLMGGTVIPIATLGPWSECEACPSAVRWSPDGALILYTGLDSTGRWTGALIPRLGGIPRPLPSVVSHNVLSPDGLQLAAWSENPELPIVVTRLATGETRRISIPESFGWLSGGDWSPNGRSIALVSESTVGSSWTLRTVDVATGRWHEVVADTVPLSPPRWSPEGRALYYLRDDDELRKASVPGVSQGVPEILQTRLGAADISVSADGSKLAYTKAHRYSNLWLATGVGERSQLTTTQLTRGTAMKSGGRLSPDGRLIAFVQSEGDRGDVFVLPTEGGVPRRVSSSGVATHVPAWSPDGHQLAFVAKAQGRKQVRTIRLDGREERTFARTEVSEDLSWAPQQRILYQRPGNQNFHWLDGTTEAEQPLVTNDSVGWMFTPFPSPDGNVLAVFWNRRPQRGVYLVSLRTASQAPVGPRGGSLLGWSADGAFVYVEDDQRRIWRMPAHGGKGVIIATNPFRSADCSLTGRSPGLVLLCSVQETVSDVWLMEEFDPALRR